jgi:hypothetical protein
MRCYGAPMLTLRAGGLLNGRLHIRNSLAVGTRPEVSASSCRFRVIRDRVGAARV